MQKKKDQFKLDKKHRMSRTYQDFQKLFMAEKQDLPIV